MQLLSFSLVLLALFSSPISTTPLPELALAGPPRLAPRQSSAPPGVDVNAEIDKLLYRTPMPTFLSLLNTKTPPYVFWPNPSANACTMAPDYPWNFDFKRSCLRHDFGYKNYRDQKRFCVSTRMAIDGQFARDLAEYCASRSWWKRGLCYSTANTYVTMVRAYRPTYSQEC